MIYCEICKLFENTFFYRTPPVTAFIWGYTSRAYSNNFFQQILFKLAQSSALFQHSFKFNTFSSKFSNVLPFFNISLPFFWQIAPMPLLSTLTPDLRPQPRSFMCLAIRCCPISWKLCKVFVWCATFRKCIELEMVKVWSPFFKKVPFLANIGYCPNFLY